MFTYGPTFDFDNIGLTGWPKKVRESSLNRIKIVNQAKFFTNFDYKMSTRILYVRIIYSMYDLICDVISCCV